jgi:hypothetical protein
MSLDLYREEIDNRLASLRPATEPEPGMFDNFLAGSGKVAMQTFAKAGRAASMAVAPLAMALEKEPGSTEVQDRFFKAHDDIFGNAVDYWTPKPGEVGAAGQVVGQLLGTLPLVLASPAATVAMTQLSTGEDLVRKGVDAGTAQAVGGVQAAGLGLGIWVPILGQTLAQRVLLGGAGFNVAQGLATRAASAELLEGTPGAEDFKALDPTALTLDVLLGAAFGGIAHINPRMRAEGDAWQARLKEWGAKLKPSEVDAMATLRQAQHLNADSLPGKPVDVEDVNAHVARMRQALDDLANDRPVQVEDLPAGRFEADEARAAEANAIVGGWLRETEAELMAEKYDFSFSRATNNLKTVAEGGNLLEVYHGTANDFANFDKDYLGSSSRGGAGTDKAFFFSTDESHAEYWANQASLVTGKDARIIKANLNVKNLLEIDFAKLTDEGKAYAIEDAIQKASDENHDGIFIKNIPDDESMTPRNMWLVFEPKQIAILNDGEHAAKVSPQDTAPPRAEAAPAAGKPDANGGEQIDPLATTAARFAAENPDLPIVVGKNADGSNITTTPRQWLEDADAAMRQAQDDARLFEIAAGCLLGGGR